MHSFSFIFYHICKAAYFQDLHKWVFPDTDVSLTYFDDLSFPLFRYRVDVKRALPKTTDDSGVCYENTHTHTHTLLSEDVNTINITSICSM